MPALTIAAEYDPEHDPSFQNLKQLSEAQARVIESSAEAQRKNRNELAELRAEIERMKEVGSIKQGYMQFADVNEIMEMRNTFDQKLKEIEQDREEISKLKEMMLKSGDNSPK